MTSEERDQAVRDVRKGIDGDIGDLLRLFASELTYGPDAPLANPETLSQMELSDYADMQLNKWVEAIDRADVDPEAFDALRWHSATFIRCDVLPMLRARDGDDGLLWRLMLQFAADVLDGTRKRPTRQGRRPSDRELMVYIAVVALQRRYGLQAYSETSRGVSAVEIVAEATQRSEDAIKKAYLRGRSRYDKM